MLTSSFYGAVILATVGGIILTFIGVEPLKARFWTAGINRLLAPFLLAGILLIASDRAIMCSACSSLFNRSEGDIDDGTDVWRGRRAVYGQTRIAQAS